MTSLVFPRIIYLDREPTNTDDSSKGYVIGQPLINTSVLPHEYYICVNNTQNNAIWKKLVDFDSLIDVLNSYVDSNELNNVLDSYVDSTELNNALAAYSDENSYIWKAETSNYTAWVNDGIIADSRNSAFTITLPSTPSTNDKIFICDLYHSWETNNVTVAPDGNMIHGVEQNLILDVRGASVELIFVGVSVGWAVHVKTDEGLTGAFTSELDMDFHKISNLASPVDQHDAVTKQFLETYTQPQLLNWKNVTGNYTAQNNDGLLCDSSGQSFTITLPQNPAQNTILSIIDISGSLATNNVLISRNGSPIKGVSEDLSLDVPNKRIDFVYANSTLGWLYTISDC